MIASIHPLPAARVSTAHRSGPAPARLLGIVAGAGLVIAGFAYVSGADGRAVRALPPETRSALLARTLQNLEAVCGGDSKAELSGFCEDQAQLALTFPECDDACTSVAREALRWPTR